jgi:hypothetical protein
VGTERRRDYMVSARVHFLYMVTWITSLLLVLSALGTWYALYRIAKRTQIETLWGVSPFTIVGALVFVTVASALTLGVYTILQTHRTLGSAYHIGAHLTRLNAGDAPPSLILRDGFREIADEINTLQPRLPNAKAPAGNGPPSSS